MDCTNARSLLLVLCLSFFAAGSRAQTNLPFATRSQWPGYGRGSAESVAVSGDYAYLAVGDGGVTIINISDPQHPAIVAGYDIPLGGSAYDLKVGDGYAFVSAVRGFSVVNVHNPARPAFVAHVATSDLGKIDVVGNLAYVARLSAGDFSTVDLSDLAAPRFSGGRGLPGTATDLQIVGDYAFVAEKNEGLKIVNLSDTTAPIGTYLSLYDVTGVRVVGDTAYVVSFDLNFPTSGTLDIVDVSNRLSPQRTGRANLVRGGYGVRVKGNRAYVVGVENFEIFDVSDSANPKRIGGATLPDGVWATAMEVVGNYAFVAGQTAGLLIYNVSGANDPVLVSRAPLNAATEAVEVAGNYAYLADAALNVRILDVSDESNPRLVSTITNSGTTNLRVVGHYAYLANARRGLQTIDISDPAGPSVSNTSTNNGEVWDVCISGGILFAAGGTRGLQVFSLADPASPVWQTNLATTGAAYRLTLDGTRAYLASQQGMVIFDISAPGTPVKLGVFNPLSSYNAVDVSGGRAYVAEGDGINIVDVADAADPKFLGFVQLRYPSGVKVVGNFLYVSTLRAGGTGFGGAFLVDVSDPAFPRTRGQFHRNRTVNDVQLVGDRIYAAESSWGLAILKQEMPPLAFLDSGSWLPDGSFQVRWTGWGDTELFPQLQTSTDLQSWTTLTPYVSFDSVSAYVFPPTNSTQRVFRLVLPASP